MEIHENFYKGLRANLIEDDVWGQQTYTSTDGQTRKSYNFRSLTAGTNLGFADTYRPSPWYIRVGDGKRTSEEHYRLGSEISNIGYVSASFEKSIDELSNILTLNFVATGTNDNSEQITITEIGLLDGTLSSTYKLLLAYEHLDSSIVVEPGGQFTVKMTIKIQM